MKSYSIHALVSLLFIMQVIEVEMGHILMILSFVFSVDGFLLCKTLNNTDAHFRVVQKVHSDVGEPLFLTPYIEAGHILTAQHLSKVHLPGFEDLSSFSGYFTVNKECESNIFFWFFPTQHHWKKAPVVLWLQGGPGVSSLYGLFEELGPIQFSKTLKKRRYSWNVKNNILFIDQPVGTGFSFSRRGCFATNEAEVSRDLYSALMQFYQLFPSLQENKFYVTGESFAGHYVPSLAYTIHKNNLSAKTKINLSGMMIGNGLMDAMYESEHSSYLYQLGLVDHHQRDVLKGMENEMIDFLKKGDWQSGRNSWDEQVRTRHKFMGSVNDYNFLKDSKDPGALFSSIEEFIATPNIRKTLHVGNITFNGINDDVHNNLGNNTVQSVKSKVEELLEYYPVVFYHGQLDIICAYPLAVNFFRNLRWSGTKTYLQAERQQWCVEGQLVGYFKSAHNLHEVLVRAAGHTVPKDQPLWAFELMNSVTSGLPHDPLWQLTNCGNYST